MAEHKLIFVGPVGSGKTTAIATLSDTETVSTDALASDITGLRKPTTTVAFDFGQLQLSQTDKVRLFGTPGQMRFSFMWDMMINDLAADTDCVILLLDNTRNHPQRDMQFYSQEFSRLIKRSRLVVGVTRSDLRAEPTAEQYQHWLAELGLQAALFFIDARRRESLLPMLRCALPDSIPPAQWQTLMTRAEAAADYIELDDSADQPVAPYQGESAVMKTRIVDDIIAIKGVQGAVLADALGEVITSSLDHPELEEYIGFVAGMVPALQSASCLDQPRSILVKSPTGNSISVFIEAQQVLGVVSAPRTSMRVLQQQVEDILQWD